MATNNGSKTVSKAQLQKFWVSLTGAQRLAVVKALKLPANLQKDFLASPLAIAFVIKKQAVDGWPRVVVTTVKKVATPSGATSPDDTPLVIDVDSSTDTATESNQKGNSKLFALALGIGLIAVIFFAYLGWSRSVKANASDNTPAQTSGSLRGSSNNSGASVQDNVDDDAKDAEIKALKAQLAAAEAAKTEEEGKDANSEVDSAIVKTEEDTVAEPTAGVPSVFNPMDLVPEGYEPQFLDRDTATWFDYRLEVREVVDQDGVKKAESDQAMLVVTEAMPVLVLSRVVPDDLLTAAWCQSLDSPVKYDILEDLQMIDVKAGGTGDAALDSWLTNNFVNIEKGELLPQNSQVVKFMNVSPGFTCTFFVDDTKSGNIGLSLGTGAYAPDSRVVTIDLK